MTLYGELRQGCDRKLEEPAATGRRPVVAATSARLYREMTNLVVTRTGRNLEVMEYGDPHGHPAFFFHGLIGSHHQASYIAAEAKEQGLRIIAPNRPGVGASEFCERQSALEAVPDVEDLASALDLDQFSVIGISGGAPYALACVARLGSRIRSTTIISGMGPARLRGALQGMDRTRRMALEVGSRYPSLAKQESRRWADRFRRDPVGFLRRLVSTWAPADQALFRRQDVFDLFLRDLHQVFVDGTGPETFAQELRLYRNYGFSPAQLPHGQHVTLWHGLDDIIVPPSMTWQMLQILPAREAHFVPGGHFVAITISGQIIARLRRILDDPGAAPSFVARD
jgi:pimeloyl-ACP methyl ester carboxylesterase